MSRAKKFISDCTMNCSNELCAVEDRFGEKVISYHEWLTPDQARSAVEIAREEMIDKMKFYIESMVSDITFSDIDGNDDYDLNKFIDNLKQAMQDE